jgi:hypothetical protein
MKSNLTFDFGRREKRYFRICKTEYKVPKASLLRIYLNAKRKMFKFPRSKEDESGYGGDHRHCHHDSDSEYNDAESIGYYEDEEFGTGLEEMDNDYQMIDLRDLKRSQQMRKNDIINPRLSCKDSLFTHPVSDI